MRSADKEAGKPIATPSAVKVTDRHHGLRCKRSTHSQAKVLMPLIAAIAGFLLLASSPRPVSADGFVLRTYDEVMDELHQSIIDGSYDGSSPWQSSEVQTSARTSTAARKRAMEEPYQKAVIHWDGLTETMILSSAIKSEEIDKFAWIVPIESTVKPEVTPADISLFEYITELFYPVRVRHDFAGTRSSEDEVPSSSVRVIESMEIDIYDITILQASSSSDLIDWLRERGFEIHYSAEAILDSYTSYRHVYFVINQVDLKNRYAREHAVYRRLNSGRPTVSRSRLDHFAHREHALMQEGVSKTDYEGYLDCLRKLRRGLGTPLRFVFRPYKPCFPLEISRINEGQTRIDVYLVGEQRYFDAGDILKTGATIETTRPIRERLAEYGFDECTKRITHLQYGGDLYDLKYDAIFEAY